MRFKAQNPRRGAEQIAASLGATAQRRQASPLTDWPVTGRRGAFLPALNIGLAWLKGGISRNPAAPATAS